MVHVTLSVRWHACPCHHLFVGFPVVSHMYITVRLGSGKTMVSILHIDLISCRFIVYYVTLLFENAMEHDRESLIYEISRSLWGGLVMHLVFGLQTFQSQASGKN